MRCILSHLAALSALSMLLLTGCATQARSNTLTNTLNAYGSTLRWGDFQSALQFVDPEIRAAHPVSQLDLARYQQVRVSEYDAGAGPVPDGEFGARQTAQISVINIHTQGERTIIDHQTWHYDEKSKHWWLTSGLPDITQD